MDCTQLEWILHYYIYRRALVPFLCGAARVHCGAAAATLVSCSHDSGNEFCNTNITLLINREGTDNRLCSGERSEKRRSAQVSRVKKKLHGCRAREGSTLLPLARVRPATPVDTRIFFYS